MSTVQHTDFYEAPFDRDVPIPVEPSKDFDWFPTGLFLDAALHSLDTDHLTDGQALEWLTAAGRSLAHAHSRLVRAVADVADRCHDPEYAHLEVATALGLTTRAAHTLTATAWTLVHHLPRVLDWLDAGLIDWPRTRVLVRELDHLPAPDAATALDALGDVSGLTTGQLGARLRTVLLDADPDTARRRYDDAHQRRRIDTWARPEGTGDLIIADLAPDTVHTAMRHLDECARHLRRTGDERTMDQLRADIAADLLTGRGSPAVKTNVTLTIDLDRLITHTTTTGDLDGWGPILGDVADRILTEHPDGTWTVRIDDPDTHHTLTELTTRRRPTTAQARAIRARHPRCVFPGCRAPATRSDLDHATRYTDGGQTRVDAMAPLCRHHHLAKDHAGWSYRIDGDHITWTSPLGQTHTTTRGP